MPTALTPTQRYTAPEITKCYLVPAIANIASPTRPELEAGQNATKEIAGQSGWEISADRVPAPDLGSKRTGRVTGRLNPGDASITFHASQTTVDVRRTLLRGTKWYVVWLDGGDVAGQWGRVFYCEVASNTPTTNVEGSENARIVVNFSILDWSESFTIPA